MLRKVLTTVAMLGLLAVPAATEPQAGVIITITAGTAQRIVTTRTMANSMLIQPLHGSSTGLVYVLNAATGITCSNGGAGTTFVAELGPSTSTSPGSAFTFPSNGEATNQSGGFNVQLFCVDGAHTGDQVAVSYDLRN